MRVPSTDHVPLNGGQPLPSNVNVRSGWKLATKPPNFSGPDGTVGGVWRANVLEPETSMASAAADSIH